MPEDRPGAAALGLVERLLRDTGARVDPLIRHFASSGNKDLRRVIYHALRPRGVRERPLLVRLSCEAVGGGFESALPAAVAVELFHFSTLVADDILDESPFRGGLGTVQRVYGTKTAVVAAELLCAAAFRSMATLAESPAPSAYAANALSYLALTYHKLYCGQFLDLLQERDRAVDERRYISMVSLTTGSLIECSTAVGAILGGGSAVEVETLARFGRALGVAMQVRDDIAELIGDANAIGKPLGGDIRQGKMRLPFIHALRSGNRATRELLGAVIESRRPSSRDVSKCIDAIISAGAIDYSKRMTARYVRHAVAHIRALRKCEARTALFGFAQLIGSEW